MDEERELEELQKKLKMLEDRAEVRKKGCIVTGMGDEEQSVGHGGSSSGGSAKRGWPVPEKPSFMKEPQVAEEYDGRGKTPASDCDEPQETRRPSSSLLRQQASDESPTEDHLIAYARLLGMDPDSYTDSLLMWIAAEGLSAPLPPDWCWYETDSGDMYYIHSPTRETQWEHPLDAHYENLFRQHQAMLQTVFLELSYLEQLGWCLALPMTKITLTPGAFLDTQTHIWLHKSWSVDDIAYPGERTRLHIEEVPIDFLKRLASCTVSPAQPGIVHLSTTVHESGAVVTRWLEAAYADDDCLSLTFRENSEAPSVPQLGSQLELPPPEVL